MNKTVMNNPTNPGWREHAGIFLRGFLMGTADIIPGVSGGTMAFILGIYERLIDAIRAVVPFLRNLLFLRWREAFEQFPWRFLLALGLGIGTAILSLAKFLHWALDQYPTFVYSVFFGLIVASILIVRNRVSKWNLPALLTALFFSIGSFFLVGMRPAQTPEALWFIFLSGMIAICAMILPGISGAFILVLLGKYQYILGALIHLELVTVLVFMLGAAVGIVSFANILHWLLDHYHDLTIAALVGFMLGSLRELWPWKQASLGIDGVVASGNVFPGAFTGEVALALGLMALGFIAVILIEFMAERRKQA
jgi:putative membrane protein